MVLVAVAVAVAVDAYSRRSLLLAAIGTFRLEGRRYSWRNDPSSEEQGEMAVFAGYCFLRTCSSRKYPYPPPPRRATEIQRGGGGGPKGRDFRGGGGGFSRSFLPGAPIKIGELLKK